MGENAWGYFYVWCNITGLENSGWIKYVDYKYEAEFQRDGETRVGSEGVGW